MVAIINKRTGVYIIAIIIKTHNHTPNWGFFQNKIVLQGIYLGFG